MGRNRVASSSLSMRRRMCALSACAPQPSQTGIELLHDENELQRMARVRTLCKCDYEGGQDAPGRPIHFNLKAALPEGAKRPDSKGSSGFLRREGRSELQGVPRALPNSVRSFPVSFGDSQPVPAPSWRYSYPRKPKTCSSRWG